MRLLPLALAVAGLTVFVLPSWPDVNVMPTVALADDDDGDDDDGDDNGGSSGGGSSSGGSSGGGSGGGSGGNDDDDDDDRNSGSRFDDDDEDDRFGGRRFDDDEDDDDEDDDRDDDRDEQDDDGRLDEDDDDTDDAGETEEDDETDSSEIGTGTGTTGPLLPPVEVPANPADDESGDGYVRGEIVSFGLTASDRRTLLANGYQVRSEQALGGLGLSLTVWTVPPGQDSADGLRRVRALAPGGTFDFNHLYSPGGTGCNSTTCWGARLVGLGPMSENACTGGGAIAIIDTAIVTGTPALANSRVETASFIRGGTPSASPDHGTAIAALLVGQLAQDAQPLAPGARLLAAEVFAQRDGRVNAEAFAIIRAVDWAASRGARVIAFSFEGAENALVETALDAVSHRISLVAAAGNSGPGGPPAYPAAYDSVIAVSAVDRRIRPYSAGTRGNYVEISAPGVDVPSVDANGDLQLWTGSSFAVPFVAAALLRARAATGGDPAAARARLLSHARDFGAPGRDDVYGYGLLQSDDTRCH